jgi:hypothetical protein
MCHSCQEDPYCECGTPALPGPPAGEGCGCEQYDRCEYCGHTSAGGPSLPAATGDYQAEETSSVDSS